MNRPAAAASAQAADVRVRVRAATGDLLTAVLAQADLPAATVCAVVSRLAPAGRPVTVERLAELLEELGFGLQLAAVPHHDRHDADADADADADSVGDADSGAGTGEG